MPFDKPVIQTSNPYRKIGNEINVSRTIYHGEVISVDDPTDGGRITVRIPDLDNQTANNDLPWCYPLIPKFFHMFPKVGEMVRVFIEDIKYPQKSRFWIGSIISQPQKINFDSVYTALSTTNMAMTIPEAAPSTHPDADGVYPNIEDIAIVGRVNTDIILKENEIDLRAGKHENGNLFKLNTKNPAEIFLNFEKNPESSDFYSNSIIMSDKIALISHTGNPQVKATKLTPEDKANLFLDGHPIPRGDVLIEALDMMRKVIIGHVHGYSNMPADKEALINKLESIDFATILQKNIVIN